ncbi:PREDICTED: uncharacterized protein LOC106786317 [Polistes canadensis]|uniref:uncharacterized protein LOC106786317 n=1 Tax=Polistes canadensis TaxID=91411 RepID=UPI000718B1AD|nr:PREDICTED: uncharacterized protein LOC106786317 [Polistes canadensis]
MAVASLYTEESFEQLDRLYEMAEQILEFRDRSSKLFRRVRELEKLKVLRMADLRAERAIFSNDDISSDLPDEDAGFAESLLDAIISSSRDSQLQRRNPRSPSSSRQRSRSLAVSEQSLPRSPNLGNRSALGIEKATFRNETSGVPKVSKWTRVKAAFKWERACPNDMTDSNIEQTPTPNTPTTKYLRIPDIASGNWSGTGELSGPSTPIGRPSSASSSNEDVFDRQRKYMSETGDRRVSRIKEISKKNESTVCNELPKDDVIVTNNEDGVQNASEIREINQGKPLIRITKESTPEPQIKISNPKLGISGKDVEVTLKKPTPTLTITIPSSEEEFRNVSSPESTSPLPSSTLDSGQSSPYQAKVCQSGQNLTDFKRQRSTAEESPVSKIQRIDSKWNKVRRAFLSNTAFSVPPSPVRIIARQSFLHDEPETPRTRSCSGSVEDLSKSSLMSNTQLETRRDYQVLREKLSAEFHQKLIEWERLKRSTGANTRSTRDAFTPSNGTTPSSPHESLLLTEERLAPEFKKKLQEWKRSKKGRRASTSTESQRVSRRRLTDWQLWRYPSKPETKVQEVMGPRRSCGSVGSTGSVGSDSKPHLCEDFVRRMEAWRRLSEASRRPSSSARLGFTSGIVDETEFLALNRVLSVFGNLEQETQQDSDDWFEQRSNYTEKSQNLKTGNEILIQTSVGSYRFEGISQEFTRKLYDWEKFRGISPRSSTFRLLGPAYAPLVGTMNDSTTTDVATATDEEETFLGGIKRSKSVGSIMEISGHKMPFIRRSASLRSLNYLTEKLKELDLMNDSSAPVDSERRPDTSEDGIIDDFEPEAMIVDIEDVIEETASPLRRIQPHQTPVYSVAASETTSIAVPLGTVTSSHEPSPAILMEVEEDSDREQQWESRSWNLRTDLSARDSIVSDNWHSFWNERTNFSTYDKSISEFGGEDRHQKSDHSYQHHSDQKLWNKKSKYLDENDESVKSDLRFGLTQNEQSLNGNKEEYNCTNLKSDVANIHFGKNNEDNTDKIWTMTDESIEATTVHSVSKSEDTLTRTLEKMEKPMELPLENNEEEQRNERKELKKYKDENDDEDINDGKKEIPIRNKNDPNPKFSYHYPSGTIHTANNIGIFSTNSTVLSSNSKSDYFKNNDADQNEISNKEKNLNKEYNTDRKIFQLRQYGDDFNPIKYSHDLSSSNIIENKYGSNSKEIRKVNILKEEEIARDNVSLIKGIEINRKTEQKQYDSFDRISTLSFKNDTFEYREPSIRTTPLTVSSQREARCVERIIINEETLKKIVVPTASNDSASNSSRSKKEDSSDASNNHSDLDEACKDNNNGLPAELGSYVVNQNVNNGERQKQKVESTSRNVFVKTKRMIFSPFRRLDDRRSSHDKKNVDESNSNQMEIQKSKSKSKSRSVSPKTSRHETIPRIPISLQWTLRSSSKEPETKDDDIRLEKRGEERSWFQKYHRRTRSGEERVIQKYKIITEKKEEDEDEKISNDMIESSINMRTINENINKKIAYLEEKEVMIEKLDEERKKVYRDPVDDGYEEIIVRETQQDHHLSAVPIFGIQEEEETKRSTITEDKLPSDLVHKLRILSNAAAKRDGRIGSCIDTMTTESRSSKLQRAKEGFLSRRGGPLCQSMLEPMTSVTQNQKDDSHLTNYQKNDLTLNVDNINRDDTNWDTSIDCPIETSSVSRSPTLSQNSNSKPELVKSASAGMINVDPDTFVRLATNNRGCESLPRTISRRDSDGPLARIVNKLRLSKLMRGKDNESGSMSTISTLCRQSLLIDVSPDLEECYENEDRSDVDEDENNKERR